MPDRRLLLFSLSSAKATMVFALLLVTSGMLPMAWDEGSAINRASGIREWSATVCEHPVSAFSHAHIAQHWHYTVEVEGHPPLYGIVIACGQLFGHGWFAPLTAARLGPMALFSVAAGAMFYRLVRRYSFAAGVGAVAALITMPRVFAHAHFASFDGPLTSCWILAWAIFPSAETSSGLCSGLRMAWAVAWGLAMGATMSCKFTGWLAPLSFIAWTVVYGNRKTASMIALGLFTALGTFWLLNPPLWHHPINGLQKFFEFNLGRAGTPRDIPTLFLGARYTQLTGLPWYNTLVWTGITVPFGTVLLSIVGVAGAMRRWTTESEGALLVLNWAVLIAARALPGAPVHDAERLILPSFAFFASQAGVGCHFLLSWKDAKRFTRQTISYGIAAVYIGSASSVVWYAPQWLSYYNLLIGGLRGADASGMEPTYYWDALDKEVLTWLKQHSDSSEKIEIAAGATANLELMESWGVLPRRWHPDDSGAPRWYVIQRRPTFWSDQDRWLVEHGKPLFVKTIRPPTWGFGPWRLDVPLIEVFSYGDFAALSEIPTMQSFSKPRLQLPKAELTQ